MSTPSPARRALGLALLGFLIGTVLAGGVLAIVLVAARPEASENVRSGGSATSRSEEHPPDTHERSPTPDPLADRVVLVTVDGLNPDALDGHGTLPGFERLAEEGASTRNARTAVESTRTLPNHASIFTGRPVFRAQEGHGVTMHFDPGREVDDLAGERVRSVFDVVHRAGGETAFFASKPKFELFDRSWPQAIDTFVVNKDNRELVTAYLRQARREPPTMTMIHLSEPDKTGHDQGFMSPRYLRAVAGVDREITRLLEGLATGQSEERTVLVVTSDHGGQGEDHNDERAAANFRVPLFVWGPGVARGADLYELNPEHSGPGSAQVPYAGRRAIRNGDVANLALDLLGRPPVPGSQLNFDQELDVTR